MATTTLRTRFLLVTILCVLLPMGIIGAWIARSARQSGEDAVRLRLESSLRSTEQVIAYRWIEQRSTLLSLAGDPRLREAIRARSMPDIPPSDSALMRVSSSVDRVLVFDEDGAKLGELEMPRPEVGSQPFAAAVEVSIPVYAAALGGQIGRLDARVRIAELLPPGLWSVGIGGAVVGIFDVSERPLVPSPLDAELLSGPRFSWNGDDWVAVRRTLHEPPVQIALAAPLGPIEEPFLRATRQGFLALIAVSILALAAAVTSTNRLTRSLEQLSRASVQIAEGRLDHAVPESGSAELRRLSHAFNAMTANLRSLLRTVSQQRAAAEVGEFAATLAHEIRNPLSAVRLDLEHVRRRIGDAPESRVLDEAIGQIDRLDATVRGTLRIAASGSIERVPLDLRDPLIAAVRGATPRAEAVGARIDTDLPAWPITVSGSPVALEQLALNLLLNAVEATGQGGSVSLSVHQEGSAARTTVDDDGAGIDDEDLARAFEPFFTSKPEGTGLGLAVARRIAAAHGGELRLERRAESGTRATFTVPIDGRPT